MNAYVLTGGLSSRMGQPKAAIPFGGSTFLQRVMDAAAGAFDAVVEVPREPGNDDPAAIYGVASALALSRAKCFVIAVDYPLLTAELLRELRRRFESTGAPMLVPRWHDRLHVLCAGYSPELLSLIGRRIAARRLDLHGLLAEAGGEIIGESELRARFPGEPLMNVNTPEELEEAMRHL